jgi:HlyD family secretion protein
MTTCSTIDASRGIFNATAPRFVAMIAALVIAAASCANKREAIQASGTIEATEIRVSSLVSGKIISMSAKEGELLRRGDPIASIDHAGLDIQLGQAQAGVELARAQLDLLLVGARAEDLAQAEAALVSARETAKVARADAVRMAELFAGGSATVKQKDEAESRAALADAQEKAAEQALRKLSSGARPEELRAAKARLDQAEWAVRAIRKQIEDCSVTAPIAGIVSKRLAEPGELVSAGSALVTMIDPDSLSLTIYVPETVLASVSVGAAADVRIDSAPERSFHGQVSHIASKAEFTPKNVQTKDERVKQVFAVKIALGSGEGVLKPGMPADAFLDLE